MTNIKDRSMELEKKHVLAYLDGGLKVEYKGKAKIILGIKYFTPWSNQTSVCISKDTWTYLYEVKPILRPLSDLTKEIEHNGEKFVPIERINADGNVLVECGVNGYGKDYLWLRYADGDDSIYFSDFENIRQQLLEWKFDIFELIPNNLAVPVTDSFNPYK